MGNIEFTELQVVQGPTIEFTELEITGSSTLGNIEFTELLITGVDAPTPVIFVASTEIADAGQIISFTATGGVTPYAWAVVSMTNGITAPTITVAGDTLSATVKAPPSIDGTIMVVGLTATGATQVQKTIQVLGSTILRNVAGVTTPVWMEQNA